MVVHSTVPFAEAHADDDLDDVNEIIMNRITAKFPNWPQPKSSIFQKLRHSLVRIFITTF